MANKFGDDGDRKGVWPLLAYYLFIYCLLFKYFIILFLVMYMGYRLQRPEMSKQARGVALSLGLELQVVVICPL